MSATRALFLGSLGMLALSACSGPDGGHAPRHLASAGGAQSDSLGAPLPSPSAGSAPSGQMLALTALGSAQTDYSLALTPDGHTLASRLGSTVTLDATGAITATSPYGGKIAVDAAGNIILTGSFTGSIDLGSGALQSAGGEDVFIAKYDPSWNPLWAQAMGGAGDEHLLGVAVDRGGNVIFDATNLGTVKLGADGATSWTDPVAGVALAVDPSDNVLRIDNSGGAATVSKLDPGGTTLWSRSFSGTGEQTTAVLGSDANGNVIVGGHFNGDLTFGGANLHYPPHPSPEAPPFMGFLVKLGPDGSFAYSVEHGTMYLASLATGPSGEAVLTGRDFAFPPILALVKYDAKGQQIWQQSGPPEIEHGNGLGRAVAIDRAGQVLWSLDAVHGSQALGSLVAYVARFQP